MSSPIRCYPQARIQKNIGSILLLGLCSILGGGCATPVDEGFGAFDPYFRRESQLTAVFGPRDYGGSDTAPLDDQIVTGLTLAERISEVFWLEGGFQVGFDENSGLIGGVNETSESRVLDYFVGFVAQPFPRDLVVTPYAGFGFAFRDVRLETLRDETFEAESDLATGGYGKLGLRYEIYPRAFIGIELRAFRGSSVSLNGDTLDTDSNQIVFITGTGL